MNQTKTARVIVLDNIAEEGLAKLKAAENIEFDIKTGLKGEELKLNWPIMMALFVAVVSKSQPNRSKATRRSKRSCELASELTTSTNPLRLDWASWS